MAAKAATVPLLQVINFPFSSLPPPLNPSDYSLKTFPCTPISFLTRSITLAASPPARSLCILSPPSLSLHPSPVRFHLFLLASRSPLGGGAWKNFAGEKQGAGGLPAADVHH